MENRVLNMDPKIKWDWMKYQVKLFTTKYSNKLITNQQDILKTQITVLTEIV